MEDIYDIAVIGGGPAGMMAAYTAAAAGARVVLLERNIRPGKKLLLTGGTRCNITNTGMTKDNLINLLGKNGRFLFSAFSVFGVAETIDFFTQAGLAVKEEAKGCIFTQADRAAAVIEVFEQLLKQVQVVCLTGMSVTDFILNGQHIEGLLVGTERITAKKYIIATGGNTYTMTGSTGDGFLWAKRLGHRVITPRPALAPLILKESWIKELQGLSLAEATCSVWQGKKLETRVGDMLFTEQGVTGPLIHNLSRLVGEKLPYGEVRLSLDLFPEVTVEQLDLQLQKGLPNNKLISNYLYSLVPQRLALVILQQAQVPANKICNTITRDERQRLVRLCKDISLVVSAVAGPERAMITAGGVALDEVDSKTMASRIIDNLYFAGEVLDLDGPSGGYNLQICWTTGYAAGKSAAQ